MLRRSWVLRSWSGTFELTLREGGGRRGSHEAFLAATSVDEWLRDPWAERTLCEINEALGADERPSAPTHEILEVFHQDLKRRVTEALESGRLRTRQQPYQASAPSVGPVKSPVPIVKDVVVGSSQPTPSSSAAPPAQTASRLTQAQQRAIAKIDNATRDHVTPGDVSGAVADQMGSPIPKRTGGYWDHAQEMQDTLRGLRKNAQVLEGVEGPAAAAARQKAFAAIEKIEAAIKGAGI
jgi:hypothetical protein